MLLLVGLMGMLAVGATAMLGDSADEVASSDPDMTGGKGGDVNPEMQIDIGQTLLGSEEVNVAEPDVSPTSKVQPVPEETRGQTPAAAQDVAAAPGSTEDGLAQPTQPTQVQTGEVPSDLAAIDWGIQTGSGADEVLAGADENEFLLGYGGDDVVSGGGGSDQIEGGDGEDTLSGGAGNDLVEGDSGNDELSGDAGDDTLLGHDGDDLLLGGEGHDSMIGGQGDDTLEGNAGDDLVRGYHGNDQLRGETGEDTLFGGEGDDVLIGLGADGTDDGHIDYLNGGAGDDQITAGAGDIVSGGDGADVIQFCEWNASSSATEVMDFDAGEDSLVVLYDPATYTPDINVEQDAMKSGLYRVLADGQTIAEIYSNQTVTVNDIALVAQANG